MIIFQCWITFDRYYRTPLVKPFGAMAVNLVDGSREIFRKFSALHQSVMTLQGLTLEGSDITARWAQCSKLRQFKWFSIGRL